MVTDDHDLFVGALHEGETGGSKLWYATLTINNCEINFKLDTGSEANIIPKAKYERLGNIPLQPARCRLITYTRQPVTPIGEIQVKMRGKKSDISNNGKWQSSTRKRGMH